MADLKAFAEQLVNLTVKEVNELAAILKDEYGIEPAAAAAVMVAGGGGAGDNSKVANGDCCRLHLQVKLGIPGSKVARNSAQANQGITNRPVVLAFQLR